MTTPEQLAAAYEELSRDYDEMVSVYDEHLSKRMTQLEACERALEEMRRERDGSQFLRGLADAKAEAAEREVERLNHEAGALELEVRQLREALGALYDWSSRMPDAGFTAASPRYLWWFERPIAQVRFALYALGSESE